MGVSDLSGPEAHRYCHISQMHSDQRIPDIHSCCRLNMFHSHRMLEGFIRRRRKRSACLRLRYHIYHGITIFYRSLFFQNQCTVQMLTTLRSQIYPGFLRGC